MLQMKSSNRVSSCYKINGTKTWQKQSSGRLDMSLFVDACDDYISSNNRLALLWFCFGMWARCPYASKTGRRRGQARGLYCSVRRR